MHPLPPHLSATLISQRRMSCPCGAHTGRPNTLCRKCRHTALWLRHVAAERDGENDPLWYIRDELAANGKLPPLWLSAPDLLWPDSEPGSEEASR
jgi:hypothetical protein